MKRRILILVLVLFVAFGTHAEGDKESNKHINSTATIKGKITDATTAEELVCAKIHLEGTGISTCTDVNGEYEIEGLAPGHYSIKVEYISYKEKSLSNIQVNSRKEQNLNIQLESL